MAALLVLLLACMPRPEAVWKEAAPSAPASTVDAPAAAEITGRWQIALLDGAPPRGFGRDRGGEREPHIVFSPTGYGGSTGCNSFGGLGFLEGDRYYGAGAVQTQIGCGDLEAQEQAIIGLFSSAPRVSSSGSGALRLTTDAHEIVLRRDQFPGQRLPPVEAPLLLAGTSWTIHSVKGQPLRSPVAATLTFEADSWSMRGPCGDLSGGWRQQEDRIVTDAVALRPARGCTVALLSVMANLLDLMGARPRFVTGPNGEILIGGGYAWAVGERPRPAPGSDAAILAGGWDIIGIDGAPPAADSRPRLWFGPAGYGGDTGCNSLQGLFIAQGRRLFTGWGAQTERACAPPISTQEARIGALLAAAPRIALATGGEIALVDARGRLQLRRTDRGAGWAFVVTPLAGAPLEAEIVQFDGEPVRRRPADPETRFRLAQDQWELRTGCARLGGVWRREDGALAFFTDAEAPPAGACAGILAEKLFAWMRMFNGRARGVVGQSGELLIAGDEHWLTARIEHPTARRR
jgi:heat shock protein HslJ